MVVAENDSARRESLVELWNGESKDALDHALALELWDDLRERGDGRFVRSEQHDRT